jgi:hypothetical protein
MSRRRLCILWGVALGLYMILDVVISLEVLSSSQAYGWEGNAIVLGIGPVLAMILKIATVAVLVFWTIKRKGDWKLTRVATFLMIGLVVWNVAIVALGKAVGV